MTEPRPCLACRRPFPPALARTTRKYCDACWLSGPLPVKFGHRKPKTNFVREILDTQVWPSGLVTEYLECGHIMEHGPLSYRPALVNRTCTVCKESHGT